MDIRRRDTIGNAEEGKWRSGDDGNAADSFDCGADSRLIFATEAEPLAESAA
jgi:hypothetical protein